MNLIAVFVENKPGQTARITKIIADAGVDIHWLTIVNSGSFGVMKFLVNKLQPAVDTLKSHGLMVSLLEILALEVPNQLGALRNVAEILGSHGVNLASCSGFVANSRAILLLETQELDQARKILEQQNYRLLSQQEVLSL